MVKKTSNNSIIVSELFGCRAPLHFFERCSACVRFQDNCPDLAMGIEILRRKKKIVYGKDENGENGNIHVSAFKCTAPVSYFERTRGKCPHAGRCREEGLVLALLDGKKSLDYSYKEVIELDKVRRRKVIRPARLKPQSSKVAAML